MSLCFVPDLDPVYVPITPGLHVITTLNAKTNIITYDLVGIFASYAAMCSEVQVEKRGTNYVVSMVVGGQRWTATFRKHYAGTYYDLASASMLP